MRIIDMNRMVIVSLVVAQWRVGAGRLPSLGTSLLPRRTKVGRIDTGRHPRSEKLRFAVEQDPHRSRQGAHHHSGNPPNE